MRVRSRYRRAERLRTALNIAGIVLALAALLLLARACRSGGLGEAEVDPHEGQVYINDGFGMVWMTPLEGVDVNMLAKSAFRNVNGRMEYTGSDYEVMQGVDVSEHQREIDWAKVAASGVDFAFIRLGYRGYTEGAIYEDPHFAANMAGASANGVKLGVYFFSQAVTADEAAEEAAFVIERLKSYKIDLSVVYDWEKMPDEGANARTYQLDEAVLNSCAVAFCEAVKAAGYEPCVYFNRALGYYSYDLSELTDYKFWVAVPGDYPDFYYASDIWQYSFTSAVPGIEGETDMNLMFTPIATPSPSPEAQTSPSASPAA